MASGERLITWLFVVSVARSGVDPGEALTVL